MKRFLSIGLILVVGFLLAACGDKTVKGSGQVTTQVRSFSQFDHIKATGALTVIVTANQSPHVSVTADDNLLPYIVTEVKKNTLEISPKKGYLLAPTQPIRLQINTNKLSSLSTAGAVQVHVTGLSGDAFDMSSTGTSQLTLMGKVDKASFELTGTSRLDARNLITKRTDLDVSGSAKAAVYVTKKLEVKISGAGSVVYYGRPPLVNQAVFGKGFIQPAGQ